MGGELVEVPDFGFLRSGKLLQEAKITGNVVAEAEITQMLFHKGNGFRPLSKGRMAPSSREPARRRFGQRKTPAPNGTQPLVPLDGLSTSVGLLPRGHQGRAAEHQTLVQINRGRQTLHLTEFGTNPKTVPREKYESKGQKTDVPSPLRGSVVGTQRQTMHRETGSANGCQSSPHEPGHQGRHPCRHQKREQVVQTVEAKKSRQPHQQNGAFHLP